MFAEPPEKKDVPRRMIRHILDEYQYEILKKLETMIVPDEFLGINDLYGDMMKNQIVKDIIFEVASITTRTKKYRYYDIEDIKPQFKEEV